MTTDLELAALDCRMRLVSGLAFSPNGIILALC